MSGSQIRVNPEELRIFVSSVFEKLGVPKKDAFTTADVLVSADLRGIESHGTSRLPRYVYRLENGLINKTPQIRIVREKPCTLLVDGDNGLGQVVGVWAMDKCIEKANSAGIGMATVRNSNHFGIAGYYSMRALKHDMIGVSLTNSQPLVAPTFGRQKIIGTNPISVSVPASKEMSFVLDMATSIVPLGTISVHAKLKQPIHESWAINRAGLPTKDPEEVIDGGALMPLGGPRITGGHKGYGLSTVVDILSGILSGASYAVNVGSPYEPTISNIGHLFAAVSIDAFRPADEFKRDMDELIRTLKSSPKAAGQDRIYVHGEIEFEMEKQRRSHGIPVREEFARDLIDVGKRFGVDTTFLDRY